MDFEETKRIKEAIKGASDRALLEFIALICFKWDSIVSESGKPDNLISVLRLISKECKGVKS